MFPVENTRSNMKFGWRTASSLTEPHCSFLKPRKWPTLPRRLRGAVARCAGDLYRTHFDAGANGQSLLHRVTRRAWVRCHEGQQNTCTRIEMESFRVRAKVLDYYSNCLGIRDARRNTRSRVLLIKEHHCVARPFNKAQAVQRLETVNVRFVAVEVFHRLLASIEELIPICC